MVIFNPQLQFALCQFGPQALARTGLLGLANGLAALVEENAVAAAKGGQWADGVQGVHLVFQAQAALLEAFAHGPRQALGQAVEALAQQGQAAAWMLGGEARI